MKNLTNPQTVRVIAGSAIILFGLATLLGSLNLFNFNDIFGTWWPILVVIGGFLMLASTSRSYTWALLVILLGVLWQLEQLGIIDFSIWQLFWPLVLVAIGWSIITDRGATKTTVQNNEDSSNLTVFLGGIDTKNTSKNYRGGKLSAIMGGGSLDLRQATIKKEATLEVFALMGGFEIKVPENWKINSQITPILGGVENKTTPNSSNNTPTLHLVGTAVMGGIEIKN